MKETRFLLKYNLQFFAEGPGGEKTEEPTAKKLSDARNEGQVAKSNELNIGVSLFVMFLCTKIFIGSIGNQFTESFIKYYGYIGSITQDRNNENKILVTLADVLIDIMIIMFPFLAITLITSFVVTVVQVKWKVSTKPLKPKFSKFNPVQGFKKMFEKDKVMELIKAVVKIGIICYMVYSEIDDQIETVEQLYSLTLMQAIFFIGDFVLNMALKISALFFIIGLADYIYQKRKFKKDMRMTKQEIKDEFKQTEGDPQIKGRIRSKMREVSQRRMMQQLPQADVVITNPTHLAVALKYDKEKSEAPIVIAKGADFLAAKIREVAKEHDITIVENKPLARMLYTNVEVGGEIPSELYQMVAEVLAYVYRIKNKV